MEFVEALKAIAPDFSAGGEVDELFVESLEKSKALCCQFASVTSVIAEMNSNDAATALYQGFGNLLSEYWPNPVQAQGKVGIIHLIFTNLSDMNCS